MGTLQLLDAGADTGVATGAVTGAAVGAGTGAATDTGVATGAVTGATVGAGTGAATGAEDGLGAGADDGSVRFMFSMFEVDERDRVVPTATPNATATSTTMAILQRGDCFMVTLMLMKPSGVAFWCWS